MKNGRDEAINVDRLRPAYKLQELQPAMLVPKVGQQAINYRDNMEMPNLGFTHPAQPLQMTIPQDARLRSESVVVGPLSRSREASRETSGETSGIPSGEGFILLSEDSSASTIPQAQQAPFVRQHSSTPERGFVRSLPPTPRPDQAPAAPQQTTTSGKVRRTEDVPPTTTRSGRHTKLVNKYQ